MAVKHSLQDVCKVIGKNHVYLGQIQSALELYKPEPPKYYKRGYIDFLTKCTALRTFGVGLGDIQDLFRKEVKVARLLHLDTHSDSPTWYLDGCNVDGRDPNRLLLTGINVGFPVMSGPVQSGLDFGSREPELFESHQMGENLEHVMELYRRQVLKIRRKVEEERPIIRTALSWSNKAFHF
ncbi:MAG: hypothetical protein JJU29_05820 [Verrucomicrobia bacterium]|nr:hypothetical protein [Verrucomicrobiota bacterium]MCH8510684.1 hypothetical protein [Kiritimatiellia bacterium]